MKITTKLIIVYTILFFGCNAWKKSLEMNGNYNTAVKNAIYDFSGRSPLRKNDSVFYVGIKDFNEVLGVYIIGDENKFYPDSSNKIGTNHSNFPTRYMEVNNKLYIWYDSTQSINMDLLLVLSKYKHIDSLNVNGFVWFPQTMINDDNKKSEHYYFCKSNLRKYKRIRKLITMGWYEPLTIECP